MCPITALWIKWFIILLFFERSSPTSIGSLRLDYSDDNVDFAEIPDLQFEEYDAANLETSSYEEEPQTSGIFMDEWEYDDHEDYDIEYIEDFAEQAIGDSQFTQKDINAFRAEHNRLRGNIGGPLFQTYKLPEMTDQQFMEWDNVLAWLSQNFVDLCIMFRHEKSPGQNITLGQNLYFGSRPEPRRNVYLWYTEIQFVDLATRLCTLVNVTSSYTCGHFYQVMWADSRLVGCAKKYCWPALKRQITCCHYVKPGYVPGEYGFEYGKACNKCRFTKTGLCSSNLCVNERMCRDYKLSDCKCNAECQNCGIVNPSDCTCHCPAGFDGMVCGEKCRNLRPDVCGVKGRLARLEQCDNNNQLPRKVNCRAFCKTCKIKDPHETYDMCCQGIDCPEGYSINETDCHCVIQCPGKFCSFNETEAPYEVTAFTFETHSMPRTSEKVTSSTTTTPSSKGSPTSTNYLTTFLLRFGAISQLAPQFFLPFVMSFICVLIHLFVRFLR